ncbi:MAG: hypothetical protein OEV95_13165, partial [Gemmatimonadota bacterium]|nr:hypothetical protein [Gemmatimonadota bacterium]
MNQTAAVLHAELLPLRWLAIMARGGVAAGAAAGVLGGFAWLFRLDWLESLWWVPAAWMLAGAFGIGLGWLGVRRLLALSPA